MKLGRSRLLSATAIRNDRFAYRRAWLHRIHVATTGNDTTGNGSKLTPYKTFTKAMTIAVAGDGILVANGTYAENTAAGGNWSLNKAFASQVVIEPELGAAGAVTITGTSADINIYFGPGSTTTNIKFRYLTFSNRIGSSTMMRLQGTVSNITFDHCTFAGATGAAYGVYNGIASTNVLFDHCSFTEYGNAAYSHIYAIPNGLIFNVCTFTAGKGFNFTTTTVGHLAIITDCVINSNLSNIFNGGTYTITGTTITQTVSVATAAEFGVDGVTGNATTPTLRNCTINKSASVGGHGLLIGAGCVNAVVDNVTIPTAYDYGIVCKQDVGSEVKNCNVTAPLSALYFKASTSPNAHNNVLSSSTYGTFQLQQNSVGGAKCSNWRFNNNIVNVSGTSRALKIGGAADDTGGGVCDYNTYQSNAGSLGSVRNDSNVLDLTELQAAWADYDVTTNDANSTVI